MKDNLLDTEQKQADAVGNAKSFMVHPFWPVFEGILKANILVLKNRLATEEFTKVEEVQEIQKKIQAYEDAMGVPAFIIERYSPDSTFNEEVEVDPFQNIEQFRLELRKQRKA